MEHDFPLNIKKPLNIAEKLLKSKPIRLRMVQYLSTSAKSLKILEEKCSVPNDFRSLLASQPIKVKKSVSEITPAILDGGLI